MTIVMMMMAIHNDDDGNGDDRGDDGGGGDHNGRLGQVNEHSSESKEDIRGNPLTF